MATHYSWWCSFIMAVSAAIRVLLSATIVAEALNSLPKDRSCNKLRTDSHFETDKLVGKTWRAYYAWDLQPEISDRCHDISFKNATSRIINRIWNDMYEHLETQPPWGDAVLLMTINPPRQEMLLFRDEGIPGRFIGVGNIVRIGDFLPTKKNSLPLFKIHMKLLDRGRYLIVSDCNIDVTTLAIQPNLMPFRGELEIVAVANTLGLGDGHIICPVEKNIEVFEADKI